MRIIKRILAKTTVLSLAFILGITAAGSYHVEATADSHDKVSDSIASNNVKSAAISDPQPDLVVQDIALSPANPSIGDAVTITVTIKNQGTAAAGSSRIAYYIDDIFQASGDINQVNPGATAANTFTWTAQVGSHTIKAVADSDAQVAESDETNNTRTFIFTTLAPDLIVQSISWSPANPSRGDNITFSVTIKNQGSSTSRSTRVNFYIDGNSRGYQDVYSLEAGGTLTRTYTWVASGRPAYH